MKQKHIKVYFPLLISVLSILIISFSYILPRYIQKNNIPINNFCYGHKLHSALFTESIEKYTCSFSEPCKCETRNLYLWNTCTNEVTNLTNFPKDTYLKDYAWDKKSSKVKYTYSKSEENCQIQNDEINIRPNVASNTSKSVEEFNIPYIAPSDNTQFTINDQRSSIYQPTPATTYEIIQSIDNKTFTLNPPMIKDMSKASIGRSQNNNYLLYHTYQTVDNKNSFYLPMYLYSYDSKKSVPVDDNSAFMYWINNKALYNKCLEFRSKEKDNNGDTYECSKQELKIYNPAERTSVVLITQEIPDSLHIIGYKPTTNELYIHFANGKIFKINVINNKVTEIANLADEYKASSLIVFDLARYLTPYDIQNISQEHLYFIGSSWNNPTQAGLRHIIRFDIENDSSQLILDMDKLNINKELTFPTTISEGNHLVFTREAIINTKNNTSVLIPSPQEYRRINLKWLY